MEHTTTVLIADSSEEFSSALAAALQRSEGFQVVATASDGEQALRLIGERKPDVLVLDLMLSKQDGISVLKAISGMERRPVTLATSAFVTEYVSSAYGSGTKSLLYGLLWEVACADGILHRNEVRALNLNSAVEDFDIAA